MQCPFPLRFQMAFFFSFVIFTLTDTGESICISATQAGYRSRNVICDVICDVIGKVAHCCQP